ncbi:hypothetical protein AHiyo1_07740 [Arthrobacter sp. Hiyo1]|nr:hypothetical protein AHiyo1_07740 [Arthrobacter sp. Hiyo1]
MAKAFKYGLKGITGYLEPAERELLRGLVDDVISMLEPELSSNEDPLTALIGLDMNVKEPSDRALLRLLPNVMKNDDAASLEFRQLTERSLREGKIGALRAAAMGLDRNELVLTPEEAKLWSMALNDVRLVLAERSISATKRMPTMSMPCRTGPRPKTWRATWRSSTTSPRGSRNRWSRP